MEDYYRFGNGWLNPIGQFYPCKSGTHWSTAEIIQEKLSVDERANPFQRPGDPEQMLERLGWVKLKDFDWLYICTKDACVSKKQYAYIADWYLLHSRLVPSDMEIR